VSITLLLDCLNRLSLDRSPHKHLMEDPQFKA